MRFVLILIVVAAMAFTAWHAVNVGTDRDKLLGAPQIERIVDDGVRTAVLSIATHPIQIETDGRNVRLSGPVNSEAEHQDILAAARDARLLVKLTDDLVVLPRATPFRFSARKSLDEGIVLSGNVPTVAAREALLSQARTEAEGAVVSDRLIMAAGAPDGDWQGMAATGLTALSALRNGEVSISDEQAVVTGAVTDIAAGQRLLAAVNEAPMGDWQVQIAGALPVAEEYTLNAMKNEDGSIILDGNAPDEGVREDLLTAAQAASTQPVGGSLTLAEGMPGPEWPETMLAGIAALNATANGLLSARDSEVSFTAEVETDDDLARLLPLIGDTWNTDIKVRNPTPDARLAIVLGEDGSLSAEGLLPEGVTADEVAAALPGLNGLAFPPDTFGRPADWTGPLQGLDIILPRFQTADALVEGSSVTISGKLKRGFSADGAEAAMKSALDRAWTLELDLVESAPLAELILSDRDGQTVLSGVLPNGIDAEAALTLLGQDASGEGLSTGGEGDPAAWAQALTATEEVLSRFRDATGRVSEGQVELDGSLLPGYPASDIQEWSLTKLPEGWGISVSADELAPNEGDRRVNLKTGEDENFRRGYWLPNVVFEVSAEQCTRQIDAALEAEDILFVTGSARIDQKGRALLNRLAAVAVRCLNSSSIALEIGGHTDSVGNDDNNLILSQERADAVRDALADRGVRADAMTAIGFGETSPIATNNTAEGRAQNRRITFGWSESGN